jgi:hypothetical protein
MSGYAAYISGRDLAALADQVNKAFEADRKRIEALEAQVAELTKAKPAAKPAANKS